MTAEVVTYWCTACLHSLGAHTGPSASCTAGTSWQPCLCGRFERGGSGPALRDLSDALLNEPQLAAAFAQELANAILDLSPTCESAVRLRTAAAQSPRVLSTILRLRDMRRRAAEREEGSGEGE